jgi:hypothetical protein
MHFQSASLFDDPFDFLFTFRAWNCRFDLPEVMSAIRIRDDMFVGIEHFSNHRDADLCSAGVEHDEGWP